MRRTFQGGAARLTFVAASVLAATSASVTRAAPVTRVQTDDSVKPPGPDPENREKPELSSADLTERAHHLFDAVVKGDGTGADDFFFPAEPFVPLKDVSDPARYFAQLLSAYHRDVVALHRGRKNWDEAKFVSFELGTAPTWVKPGDEYNKIGYFRTYNGKLRFEIAGHEHVIEVHTIISWAGRWYVTHLTRVKH